MGLSASSIIPLLSKWEEYLTGYPDGDLPGFARWILNMHPLPANPMTILQTPLLLAHLYRTLQWRSKPIAKELGLAKPLEFEVLMQISIMDRPNKKELSKEMFIEGSTGVEITKRLADKGFINEKPDSKDRRSARLSLTEKGQQTLLKGYTKLSAIHTELLNTLPPLS